ncbi:hypothetical protein Tco_0923942, partial [Tanacetum coccineum]
SIKVKEFQRSFRHSDTERLSRSDEVLKLKNFKKDATLKLFKSTNQERYEHPSDPSKNVADEAVHKELSDSLVRAVTTASSLEAEQDSGNINKTQSMATPNESSSLETTSGGNTLRSDEDRLKLDELMTLSTTLQNRVLDLEKTNTTQDNEIASLKRRVKKLEKKHRSRTHKLE